MNVIAADMCTNARRVRKRWLPKIKSMLPEGIEVYRGTGASGLNSAVPLSYEPEFRPLFGERKDLVRTAVNSPQLSEVQGEEEEDEEDEDGTIPEGAEGSLGASPLLLGEDGEVLGRLCHDGQQLAEFGEGLRINGQ